MVYYILIIVLLILIIIIINKDNKIKIIKRKNELFKEQLRNNQNEIMQLQSKVTVIINELKKRTEIKGDYLSLNIVEKSNIPECEFLELEENLNPPKNEFDSEKLNEEKQKIFNLMENTNMNLFVTGKAGTGKSYLLKYFRHKTKKRVLYTAPTGIAALNIEGVTLHSAFGFKNLQDSNDIILSRNKKELFRSIDTIVIDEISMVRVDIFNQIDLILKNANGNQFPFGGKQVILFGDLFQLPPIAKKEEAEFFTNIYGGIYFFNSPAYKNGDFHFNELEKIFRQTDKKFISILNNIRVGNITTENIDLLNRCYTPEVPEGVVQVVAKKAEANNINTENLKKINKKEYAYKASVLISDKEFKETDFPCDFDLRLKVGALVMMITNDVEQRRWVNGTVGIVSALSNDMVKVAVNNTEYEISPLAFNKYKCEYDQEEKKLKYVVEASVSQFPLIPAYAITIHKSQGMTYQQLACNLESCFAPGQAYVALSRCINFNNLYLTEKVNPRSIIIDNVVLNFYNKIKRLNSNEDENNNN